MRLIAGVEDAGRGPVIGPLVIAGVLVERSKLPGLAAIGIRDSKLLTPAVRTRLASEIAKVVEDQVVLEIPPREIDDAVFRKGKYRGLNDLEATAMARVIERLRPDVAYVDASDIDPERYKRKVIEALPEAFRSLPIVSEHHADRKYPVVSAASIIAKTHRDKMIEELQQRYGEFGSGYSTDVRTINFLKEWLLRHGDFPPIVRRSWKTLRSIENKVRYKPLEP